MTRNEMLRLIREKLLNVQQIPNFEDQILNTVEELGMKPPKVPGLLGQTLMDVYVFPNYNQWEEDVLKDERVMNKYNKRLERKKKKEIN